MRRSSSLSTSLRRPPTGTLHRPPGCVPGGHSHSSGSWSDDYPRDLPFLGPNLDPSIEANRLEPAGPACHELARWMASAFRVLREVPQELAPPATRRCPSPAAAETRTVETAQHPRLAPRSEVSRGNGASDRPGHPAQYNTRPAAEAAGVGLDSVPIIPPRWARFACRLPGAERQTGVDHRRQQLAERRAETASGPRRKWRPRFKKDASDQPVSTRSVKRAMRLELRTFLFATRIALPLRAARTGSYGYRSSPSAGIGDTTSGWIRSVPEDVKKTKLASGQPMVVLVLSSSLNRGAPVEVLA